MTFAFATGEHPITTGQDPPPVPPDILVSHDGHRTDQPDRPVPDSGEPVVVQTLEFEPFYRSHRTTIARALAVTLRDPELAADAVDEAMARAYQRWARVRSLDNPGGWVYRVGLNWSRSFLRRAGRPAPIWMTAPTTWSTPTATDPAVDRALGDLSTDQRAVVVCRLLLGWSEAQTAEALGIRAGTVKSRLSRASDRLQVSLRHLHTPTTADRDQSRRAGKD